MDELVFKGANDQAITNSLLVAEKFGKEHRHVLDAIRDLVKGCAENSASPMFEETTYVNPQNKQEYPMFIMNRDGFTLLAMGFTGKKALSFKMDFINAFNKMEALLKSDDYILMRSQQILQKRVENLQSENKRLEQENAHKQATIELQEQEIKAAAPKVKVFDDYISSDGTSTTTQIAKEYGWGAETLNKKLREMGVQYKQNGQWILYAKYDGKGYTQSKPVTFTRSDGRTCTQMQTRWTARGRELIHL